jgi:hypothetical protein
VGMRWALEYQVEPWTPLCYVTGILTVWRQKLWASVVQADCVEEILMQPLE